MPYSVSFPVFLSGVLIAGAACAQPPGSPAPAKQTAGRQVSARLATSYAASKLHAESEMKNSRLLSPKWTRVVASPGSNGHPLVYCIEEHNPFVAARANRSVARPTRIK